MNRMLDLIMTEEPEIGEMYHLRRDRGMQPLTEHSTKHDYNLNMRCNNTNLYLNTTLEGITTPLGCMA